jgi:DHA2 family integral membrane protein (MFS transporter)
MGSTFYLAYFLQAVRGYTALAAGVALIAVAAAVMVAAPLSARLSARFGPRVVTGTGLVIFGVTMMSYGLSTRTMPQWIIEVMMVGFGVGMGLVMTPATNAIMSAVPREKAGAGSAVNNTVRQVAGALGVAILGSLLAVVFRNHLGSDAPAQLAARLDQPAAVVSKLPADAQVGTYVKRDASESIGGALEFVGKATGALQQRPGTPTAQQRAEAEQAIGGFVDHSKNSFMSAMRVSSIVAGLFGLIGAIAAFLFLPSRREHAEQTADVPTTPSGEPAMAH